MEFIVDFQGFKRSTNIFVIKELAILPLDNTIPPTLCIFGPPCRWSQLLYQEQSMNKWLEKNFHGIPWNYGHICLKNYIRIIQDSLRSATKIYVKGLEKKIWLKEILPRKLIYNLEDMNCPSLKVLKNEKYISCNFQLRHHPICAVKNAYKLKKWLTNHQECQAVTESGYDEVDDVNDFTFKNYA